jgi:hypothetical protein
MILLFRLPILQLSSLRRRTLGTCLINPAVHMSTDQLALSRTPRDDWTGHREFYLAQLRDCRKTDLLSNPQWPPRQSNQKDADLFLVLSFYHRVWWAHNLLCADRIHMDDLHT